MAQGMRHGMSDRVPKMCGNELEKDGAAWMAGNEILPIGSLAGAREQKGSVAAQLAGRVFVVRALVRVSKAKDGLGRVEGDHLLDLDNVVVHVPGPGH